jgi:arabinogalactan endo-1,4-beta-galactosidase
MIAMIALKKLLIISTFISNAFASLSMLGADVSSLQQSEELGQKYFNAFGQQEDALTILKSVGVNYIRLRIWNNPLSKTNNKEKVLEYAKHVKAKGFKLMIDFHYSDYWADPGKQNKPIEWSNHNITQLVHDVYDYTHNVCLALKSQGTVPDSVQIGNEINVGLFLTYDFKAIFAHF